ncbi:MAG: hypothetical protein B6D64_07485 [Bacteroidetes bacterium 4484_276]|nr:MAG: hypothetical protein B6D64_07485 [Bacteroidetes bacterium 4484_276]OYT13679.1 MAG: hypothetical protein B6I19_03860 [Bacteroidetes bacterium 4572_114]
MLQAQESPKFGVKFSGFVKTDIFWDSRQTVSVREGHFLLYPKNESLDINGEDINDKSNFNMLSIQTRLRALATGPDVLGAKTSAFVEGAFFGAINSDVNTFRLRHAFVKLAWTKTQLLVGQYWHPMFNTKCYPGTVSFNTGAPFQPFSRNPQIRLTRKMGDFNLALTALSQRDFASFGPGGANSVYLRNTGYPAFNLRFEYNKINKDNGTEFLIGISTNYKALTPRLVTTENYKTSNTANSASFTGFIKYKNKKITVKANGFYGGDAFNLTMLGGYGVTTLSDTSGILEEYSCVRNASFWTDFHTNGKKWQFGLFAGYSKNLGSDNDIVGTNYSRGSNIDHLYRISPRVIFNAGKFRIAPEIEYTVAAYGSTQANGTVEDAKEIGNVRVLLGVYYFF